ncbi:MAG: hypothetical protein Fur0021_10430 [Candidatus Promineifilaceae bacterium]
MTQRHPDLVVLDIALGSLPDGLELCRQLRQRSHVPIIMLSVRGGRAIQSPGFGSPARTTT